jgi:hypothetical protein
MAHNSVNPNQIRSLLIGHVNVYHLFNKLHDVAMLLNQASPFHILGISETRLLSDFPSIPNYTFLSRNISFPGHTGMGIFIHNGVMSHIKRRFDLESKKIESMWIEITHKSRSSLIGFIYRNPASDADWTDDFITMLDKVTEKDPNVLILGDFNIDLLAPQPSWDCTTSLFGLHQLVNEPTRITPISATLIDHIYTNNLNMVSNVHTSDVHLSDHKPVLCTWSCKISSKVTKGHTTIQFRSMKNFNSFNFVNDLSKVSFSAIFDKTDATEALSEWYSIFNPILEKHAPLRQKRVKHATLPRWLSPDITAAMKLRNILKKEKRFDEYKKQRNKVKSMVRKAKKDYFNTLVTDNTNVASIWNAMNEFTYKKRRNTAMSQCNFSANDFNNHFTNLVDSVIQSAYGDSNNTYVLDSRLEQFCKDKLNKNTSASIPKLTTTEVSKIISNLKNKKSMGLDNINASFLKLSLPHILDSLTFIYNLCLNQNVFPSILKTAKIIPLPKSKDIGEISNFRPISLLSILSKPLEKHIFNHLISFVENHDIFHPFQSGFRQHHSCHTALTRICDSWLSAINKTKPEITGSVFLDLKKAFDLVDHNILLMKLTKYFQNANTIALLNSYLTNRTQQVFLNGTFSSVCSVKCGVPQGSVLGPLLFGLFINDLPLYLTNPNVISDLFADDNSMHSSASSIDIVESNLQQGLVDVSDWCKQNRMVLHPGKTKSMAVATRQKHQIQPLTLNLFINSCMIEQVKEHKVLGITLDQTLSWKPHIDSVCKRLSQNLFLLSQLKFYLNNHALKIFFHAHIMSHINYASTIWSGASKNNLTKLNSLHRRAVKLISDTPLVSTDQKLQNLKILPLDKQFDFNVAVLMFKIKNNMAPPYLQSLLIPSTDRYNSDRYLCPKTRVDIYKSSFAFSGPYVWNTIPINIKSVNSLQSFKSSLKHYLLNP